MRYQTKALAISLVAFAGMIGIATQAMAACTIDNLVGKWMLMRTPGPEWNGRSSRCIVNVTKSSSSLGAMSGTCYYRYPNNTTTGGLTSSSSALSAGSIKKLSVNSCAFTFNATIQDSWNPSVNVCDDEDTRPTALNISGDFALVADKYSAQGFYFNDYSGKDCDNGIEQGTMSLIKFLGN